MKRGKALILTALLLFCTILIITPSAFAELGGDIGKGIAFLGAAIAMGATGVGVGLGMSNAAAAAVGAVAERPEIFGKTLLYIVFIEAIAIYALVVAFMILVMYH